MHTLKENGGESLQLLESLADLSLSITGLSFLFVIFPLLLLVNRLVPLQYRAGVAAVFSLVYYLFVQPAGFLFMAFSVTFDYLIIRFMFKNDRSEKYRKILFTISSAKCILSVLAIGIITQVKGIVPVFGALVFVLSGFYAIFEMYRRQCPYELDVMKFILYCCFFPRLYAGPFMPYDKFDTEIVNPQYGAVNTIDGVGLVITGVFKSRIIGCNVYLLYSQAKGFSGADISILSSWFVVISFALSLFFILSGLCDIARGVGLALGYKLPQNFYYPYQSRNIHDFFERFNSTVALFLKKILHGNESTQTKDYALSVTGLLIFGALFGLWFGFRINYVLWGIYLIAFMLLEKYVYPDVVKAMPVLLCRIYTFCVVLSSFTWMAGDNIIDSLKLIKRMLGFLFDIKIYSDKLLYLISSNWLLLLVACVFSTNLFDVIGSWIGKAVPRISRASYAIIISAMLFVYCCLSV